MLADYLASLSVREVAVHLPGARERDEVVAACVEAGKTVVDLDARARVVVTADGVVESGTVRCLKDEVDVLSPGAQRVIVIRRLGDVPLAATLDAYLDIRMVPGRDMWLEQLDAEAPN